MIFLAYLGCTIKRPKDGIQLYCVCLSMMRSNTVLMNTEIICEIQNILGMHILCWGVLEIQVCPENQLFDYIYKLRNRVEMFSLSHHMY